VLAKYILAGLAGVFLAGATFRMMGDGGWSHPQVRPLLLIGVIFSVVSAWLFYQG
jgi:hypothetical protein